MSTINPVSESSAPPQAPRAGPPVADVHPGRTAAGLAGGLSGLLEELGDAALFALRGVSGVVRRVGWHTPMPVSNVLGVGSVPVVALCGLCAGMIFAAQA